MPERVSEREYGAGSGGKAKKSREGDRGITHRERERERERELSAGASRDSPGKGRCVLLFHILIGELNWLQIGFCLTEDSPAYGDRLFPLM